MKRPKTPTSLRRCFAGRLRLTLLLALVASTSFFCYLCYRALESQRTRALLDQARLCAAAITPDRNGSITRGVDQLRKRYPRLLAAATLSPNGRISSMVPAIASYRTFIADRLDQSMVVTCGQLDVTGTKDQCVCAVTVALNGDHQAHVRQALFIFADESMAETIMQIVAWACLALLTTTAIAVRSLRIWFSTTVLQLVDDVTALARRSARGDANSEVRLLRCQRWRETSTLSRSICDLVRDLNIAEARGRRIERDTQWELQQRQAGFDKQLRRAKDQALIDPLTKLRNRRFLEKELERLVAAQVARGEDLSIAMIDLDSFKVHNDTFGHEAGDEILIFVGQLLRAALRPSDHAVRYGGDEFLLLLPDTTVQDARRIVDRIAKLFAQHLKTSGRRSPLSMSAGVASLCSEFPSDATSLITRADAALYQAKRQGKSNVAVG